MRYRKLTATDDFSFGHSQLDFFINSPEAVAQAVKTTLRLWLGEWYLNLNSGTPYAEEIVGKHPDQKATADNALIAVITSVQGVENIQNFSSVIDPATRKYSAVVGVLNTIYGPTPLQIENLGNF